jgi:hypothetical protein
VYNTRLPRNCQPTDQPPSARPSPLHGEKTPERDLHAPVEEKTSLARDNHAPVTDDPDSRKQQRRNKKTPVNPSEQRMSLESRWKAVDLASKVENNLGTNTLHRRDKTKTRTPRRTPREGPPAREQEEQKRKQTQITQTPESRGLGEQNSTA